MAPLPTRVLALQTGITLTLLHRVESWFPKKPTHVSQVTGVHIGPRTRQPIVESAPTSGTPGHTQQQPHHDTILKRQPRAERRHDGRWKARPFMGAPFESSRQTFELVRALLACTDADQFPLVRHTRGFTQQANRAGRLGHHVHEQALGKHTQAAVGHSTEHKEDDPMGPR